MKKEDYMKLSKKRLAELLEERDRVPYAPPVIMSAPRLTCFEGGPCTNPFHDCVNCPQQTSGGTYITTTTTGTGKK